MSSLWRGRVECQSTLTISPKGEILKVNIFGSDRSPRRGNLGSVSVYFIDSSFVEAFKQVGRVGEGCGKGAVRVQEGCWEG